MAEQIKGHCKDCNWLMVTEKIGTYCFLSLNDVTPTDYCSFWTDEKVDHETEQVVDGSPEEEHC